MRRTSTRREVARRDTVAESQEAARAEKGEDLTRSIRTIRASARRGNDRDQCLLGALYATGEGVDLSYPEAVKWYELASASGNAEALYNLATMYWLGEGVARNRRKALRLLRKAEALGSSDAALLLGQVESGVHAARSGVMGALHHFFVAIYYGNIRGIREVIHLLDSAPAEARKWDDIINALRACESRMISSRTRRRYRER